MSRFRLGYYRTLDRVINLIELLITCHPQGFSVLLGNVEPPDSKMIHEMMSAGRVPMPDDFKPTTPSSETEAERIVYDREYFDGAVRLAGGWGHINAVSREYKDADAEMWAVVIEHTKFVKASSSRLTSKLNYVAARHRLSPTTIMKYRREFPRKLAEMLLLPPTTDGKFYLMPSN